jgi:hypothetical protein
MSYTQYYHNDAPKGTTGKDVTYNFGGTTTKDFTQTLRFDWTNAFGFTGEIGIEQSIKTPGWLSSITGEAQGKATGKFGGKFDHVDLHSKGKEYKDSRAVNWGMGSERQQGLKPQEAVMCSAAIFSGTFQSRWTGMVTARFQDGSTFDYAVKGDYDSVGWSSGSSACVPIKTSDLPKGATFGATTRVGKRGVEFRG